MRMKFLSALGTAVALAVAAAPASAAPNTNNSPKLREAVTVDGIREHMANLQTIADANGGSRLAGASGHDASAAYVKQRLEAAGYDARYQEFTYNYNGPRTAPVLSVVGGPSYASGFQFQASTSLTP